MKTKTAKRLAKSFSTLLLATGVLVGIRAFWATAADHTDSPIVTADQSADIADVYSFANGGNLVLAMTLSNAQAAPEIQLGRSIFDREVLYQFKIDNDGDAVEDLVIQAVFVGNPKNQVMKVRGPAPPEVTGTQARLLRGPAMNVRVSTGPEPIVADRGGLRLFAGVRDDPFFFDLARFNQILAGDAPGFADPGEDFFAELNAYAIVIELPLALVGDPSTLSVWGTTSR